MPPGELTCVHACIQQHKEGFCVHQSLLYLCDSLCLEKCVCHVTPLASPESKVTVCATWRALTPLCHWQARKPLSINCVSFSFQSLHLPHPSSSLVPQLPPSLITLPLSPHPLLHMRHINCVLKERRRERESGEDNPPSSIVTCFHLFL